MTLNYQFPDCGPFPFMLDGGYLSLLGCWALEGVEDAGGPDAVEPAGLAWESMLELGEASLLLQLVNTFIIGALLDLFNKPCPGDWVSAAVDTGGGSISIPFPAILLSCPLK